LNPTAKDSSMTEQNEQEFEEFIFVCHNLFKAMTRDRGYYAQMRSHLSLSQLNLLDTLADEGVLTISQIAHHAGVAVPTATRMLKILENKNIVLRKKNTSDARSWLIELTDYGLQLVKEQRNGLREIQYKHFSTLTPEQRTNFINVLQQMSDTLISWSDLYKGNPDTE